MLALVPTLPQSHFDPPAGDVIRGRDEFGQIGRMPERRGRHHRAEAQTRRARGQRARRSPGVERPAFGVSAIEILIVVGAEQGWDAVVLACLGQGFPLRPADALLTLDHQTQVHGLTLIASVPCRRSGGCSATTRRSPIGRRRVPRPNPLCVWRFSPAWTPASTYSEPWAWRSVKPTSCAMPAVS